MAIPIRVAGEIFLMTMVVRDILDPRRDPVRNGRTLDHHTGRGAGSADDAQLILTWSKAVAV